MDFNSKFSMSKFITLNSNNLSCDDSKTQIELIIQTVLQCNRIDLYTRKDLKPNKEELKLISHYIECVKSGNPIQYTLNQAPFYGRSFFVNNNVLITRFDTELIRICNPHLFC